MLALLKFIRLSEFASPPSRQHLSDAGYDLRSARSIIIPPRGNGAVNTDLCLELPLNTYGRIAPRSGLALDKAIDVGGGVIDQGYRGPVKVILFNHSDIPFQVSVGDRIAQIIVTKIEPTQLVECPMVVGYYGRTSRGSGGFGSSGVSGSGR